MTWVILGLLLFLVAVEGLRLWVFAQGQTPFNKYGLLIDSLSEQTQNEDWVIRGHAVTVEQDGEKKLDVQFQDKASWERRYKR